LDRAAERGGGVPPPQGGPVWMCGPSGGGVTAVAMALFLWQWEGRRAHGERRAWKWKIERERGRARAGCQWEARAVTGTDVYASAARSTRHPARWRSGPHPLHDNPPYLTGRVLRSCGAGEGSVGECRRACEAGGVESCGRVEYRRRGGSAPPPGFSLFPSLTDLTHRKVASRGVPFVPASRGVSFAPSRPGRRRQYLRARPCHPAPTAWAGRPLVLDRQAGCVRAKAATTAHRGRAARPCRAGRPTGQTERSR
jgi:hypothetical protein